MITTDNRPVRADEEEYPDLEAFSDALKQYRAEHRRGPAVLMDDDRRIDIPPSLFEVLTNAVEVLLEGGAVSILPYHAELTTQEAADYLGVSRPYLISILDKEGIQYHFVGSHRRIPLSEIEKYYRRRDAERRATLDELTREAYEMGLYDVPDSDEGEVRGSS